MKPKLLVCTSTFPRWKNDFDPPFVYELSKRLTDSFDITVHTPHYPKSLIIERMDGLAVHRFRYFLSPFERLAGSVGILPTLKRNPLYYFVVPFFLTAQLVSLVMLCRKVKPDIIHSHWVIPQGFMAFVAEKITGIPFVVTVHGADVFCLRGKLLVWLKRHVLNNAKAVTVVSNALLKAISSYLHDDSLVNIIPMGVSGHEFSPSKKDPSHKKKYRIYDFCLLFAGRLSEKKGVTYLIDAMPKVISFFPDVKLLILGDGELAIDLQQQVQRLHIENNIIFLGGIPNQEMPRYYAMADVFIGPSIQTSEGDTEGFGLTFVEASLSGCFVIGTDVGGISDIIQHGVTGCLVPQKDSKALAQAIIASLQDLNVTSMVAKKGRQECIQRFDWQVISNEYCLLIKSKI